MANHLIIGLGGTGGKVLREMRKRVYEQFRSNDPTGNIKLDYLYVDSSPADLNDRNGWKALGKPVHLSEAQKVSIHGISATMFNNLQMYPGINGFLNPDDVRLMTSRLGPLVTAGIGGQRRRLGRTLLANNMSVSDNNNFAHRLGLSVNSLTNASGDADVTFHVCAGLAGGTGSGSIVDVVSQIRKHFAPVEGGLQYKLFLYLYIPEMNVVFRSHDAGFYQANGYAALMELNAMSVRAYNPLDISGQKDNFTGQVQRLLKGVNAFDAAYLYSNINESGKILDITDALPSAVADFLFQKIVVPTMVNDPGAAQGETGQMAHLMGCENDGAGEEYDQANNPTRSRKFMGFGIKRIEYPETEIREYVTYSYARQAALQLQYNNWQEGIGFGECSQEEAGVGIATEVEDKKNYPKWLLSVSHLTLSTPIIETPQSKRWMDITKTWESRTQMFADDAQTNADKKSWLRIFSDDCRDYFDKNFRSLGVKKFYELQRHERTAYAKHIRSSLETTLFDEWRTGQRSLLNIEIFIRLLISNCERRITEFKERIATKQDELDSANAAIKAANKEWDNIGWLRDAITGASKKVLSAYKTATCEFYTAATWIEAYGFATVLLQSVIEQFTKMLDSIGSYRKMLNTILEEVTKQAGSKCRAEETDDMTLKKYDHDMVAKFTKERVTDHDEQKSNAGSIRQKLVEMLGEEGERSFASLLEHADLDTTVDVITDVCQRNAESAMVNTAAEDATRKLVGVNILEKIKQEYNTEEKLQAFVQSLVNSSKTFLQYNQKQVAMQFSNAGGGMETFIQLCLPEYADDKTGFRKKLIDTFSAAAPGFNVKADVATNPNANQIVVVAASAGFPLRYLTNLETLKQKYEDKLHDQDKELNRMVLHTETFQSELPSLFEMDTITVKEMIKRHVLLAYAMGLIQRTSDPTTGEKFDAMQVADAFGTKLERVGSDILTVTDTLAQNFAGAMRLKKEVESKMKTAARSNAQKAELRQKLIDIVQTVILPHPTVENNEFSPVFQDYRNLCIQLFENELKDL